MHASGANLHVYLGWGKAPLVYSVNDLDLKPDAREGASWTCKSIQFTLREHTINEGRTQLVCAALTTISVSSEICTALQDLLDGKLPKGSIRAKAQASLDE